MAGDEQWVGVDKVAAHLGVTKDSVYRWVESKSLPARRVGRLLRFKLSEVDVWVDQGRGKAASQSGSDHAPGSPSSSSRSAR